MSREQLDKSLMVDPREGMGAIGWGAAAVIIAVIALTVCSGCSNMRPVINENGGGGVAITSQNGSWLQPVLLTAGGVYLAVEIIDALKDKGSNVENSGTYNVYTSGNDTIVNSQNDSTAAHAKRVKSEGVTRRVK
jgi:hypothetical protein